MIWARLRRRLDPLTRQRRFIRWRAALMELGVQKLRLGEIKEPLAEDAQDTYQMLQVHDYLSVSFFRMDPAVKAASKQTIETFSMAYPELLAHKYFVNVPAIMGWMFGVMKLFLAPATLRKFHPMASGATLSTELKSISSSLPKEYGGQGPSVKEGETLKLVTQESKTVETKVETAAAAVAAPAVAPVETKPVEPAAARPAAVEAKQSVPDPPVADEAIKDDSQVQAAPGETGNKEATT